MKRKVFIQGLLLGLAGIAVFLAVHQLAEHPETRMHSASSNNKYWKLQEYEDWSVLDWQLRAEEDSRISACLKELGLLFSYNLSPEERSQLMNSCIEEKKRKEQETKPRAINEP